MIIRTGVLVSHPVFDTPRYAVAVVELREEVYSVLGLIKIGGVETGAVVVSNERAVLYEVMVKDLGKLLFLQSAFKKQFPLPQDPLLFGSRHKLDIFHRLYFIAE